MTNVDLNKINVLTDKTYLTDKDTWRDYEGNFYESPFNKQTSYGQRYNSKNFAKSEMPEEAHNWYEPRQVLGSDLSQTRTELGEDELPYHSKFPRYVPRISETFYTKPFASEQGQAHDVYTSSIPASGPEVPNFVETFKVGKKHFSIVAAVIVILLVVILFTTSYYIYKNISGDDFSSYEENYFENEQTSENDVIVIDELSEDESIHKEYPEKSHGSGQMFGGESPKQDVKKNEKPKKNISYKYLFDDDYE